MTPNVRSNINYYRYAPTSARSSPEGTQAAHVPARVRQARSAVRRRGPRSYPVIRAPDHRVLERQPRLAPNVRMSQSMNTRTRGDSCRVGGQSSETGLRGAG